MIGMRIFLSVAACATILAGCSRPTLETAFEGAQTVGQCEGQLQVAERDARQARTNARAANPGGGGIAGAIAIGVIGGAVESNNRTKLVLCLQRVGATDAQIRAALKGADLPAAPTPANVPLSGDVTLPVVAPVPQQNVPVAPVANNVVPLAPTGECPAGASVLFGGVGYCTGR